MLFNALALEEAHPLNTCLWFLVGHSWWGGRVTESPEAGVGLVAASGRDLRF